MQRRRRSAVLIPVSTIGAVATATISGELGRDLYGEAHHFHGPRWFKALLLCIMLYFVVEETGKVLRALGKVYFDVND